MVSIAFVKCSAVLEHACVNGRSLQTLPVDVPVDVPVDAARFPFTWCQKKVQECIQKDTSDKLTPAAR